MRNARCCIGGYRALPARRQTAFYEKHGAELRRFETAERQLKAWQDSGEKLSPKAWRKYRQYLDREIFMQRYSMRELKEETRQLEAVQRAMTKTGKERHHEAQTTR